MQEAAAGRMDQSPALWGAKDEIQQRMVKAARTLPYTLPSMYVVQRGFTDPLFGRNEQEEKVKWYNPVDVIADFAKQSVINTLSVIAPQELASGAISTARRALNTSIYSTPTNVFQERTRNAFVNLNTVLGEVGNDLAKVTNRLVRTSAQFSSAFNRASAEGRSTDSDLPQVFRDAVAGARRSIQEGRANPARSSAGIARDVFFGRIYEDPNNPGSFVQDGGILDMFPAFRTLKQGVRTFSERFYIAGERIRRSHKGDRT